MRLTEQLILGELYAQILEANGYTVTRKFNLGAREIVFPALASGQIDLEADYLATLLAFVNKNATGSTDPKATSATLQKELDAKSLTVLDFATASLGRHEYLLAHIGGVHLAGPGARAWAHLVGETLNAHFPA